MWELFAIAFIIITTCFAILYNNGKFFHLIIAGLIARFILIIFFPEITTADTADYLPTFRQFSRLVENEGVISSILLYVGPHVQFYTVLYPGYVYTIYGDSGLTLIRIINACLSILVLPLLNEINELVFNKQFKRWQAVAILFWPSYVFFSIEVGRTVVGVLFILVSVYFFLMVTVKHNNKFKFLFVIASAAVIMTRVYYAAYVLCLITIMYLYKAHYRRSYSQVGFTISIATVGSAVGILLFPYEFSIDRINSLASGIAHGGSAYLTTVYPTSFLDLLWYVPLQGLYFQFSPFLWDIFRMGGLLSVIAFFQATLVIIMLTATVLKIRSSLINWQFGLLLFTVLAVALLLGIGVKNTGAAMRWRLPSELLLITITSTVVHYEYVNND